MNIAESLGGTDTARVERLREIMTERDEERSLVLHNSYLRDNEETNKLLATISRVTLNRISTVLAEDWGTY